MKTNIRISAFILGLSLFLGITDVGAADGDAGQVQLISGNIHLAVVDGRNTPFLIGDEAVLLAETNFERNAETVQGLIATITPNPVRLVVNSHWHPDHVGGNAFFAANGALTLAHENTLRRMRVRLQNQATGTQPAEVITARHLPALTIKSEMTVHWDTEVVDLVHYPDAHTDSDVVMYYRNSNVVYIGGLLNYPMYAGIFGVTGFLEGLDQVITKSDENTKIIPWRGPVIGRAEVQEWRNLLAEISNRVTALMAEGKDLEEIVAAEPSRKFDVKWGNQRTPARFVEDLYLVLSNASQ